MNENINIAPQESKLVIYLVVAAKVIVYMLLMLGFAGVIHLKITAAAPPIIDTPPQTERKN